MVTRRPGRKFRTPPACRLALAVIGTLSYVFAPLLKFFPTKAGHAPITLLITYCGATDADQAHFLVQLALVLTIFTVAKLQTLISPLTTQMSVNPMLECHP